MSGSRPAPLAGRAIVITRPVHQAESLAACVRAAGGEVISFPTIEIVEPEDLRPFYDAVDCLQDFDRAIFVSPNAVSRALDLIGPRRTLPPSLAIAAIGDATVRALHGRGVTHVTAPLHSFDSEALLALPQFEHVTGERIVIFRGQTGAPLMATLQVVDSAWKRESTGYQQGQLG